MTAMLRSLAIFLAFLPVVHGQPSSAKLWEEQSREVRESVRLQGHVSDNQLRSNLKGETEGSLRLTLQIESLNDFHIYEERLDFLSEVDPWLGVPWNVKVLKRPEAVVFFDPVSNGLKKGYGGQNTFEIELTSPQRSPRPYPLGHEIPLVVKLQSCTEKVCLFPTSIRVPLKVSAEKPRPPTESSFWAKFNNPMTVNFSQFSVLSVFLLFMAGLLTAFTPCVYPLYPVTLGIFSRWSARYHTSPFRLALCYCAGLTLSYACLGLVSALGGFVFGALTQKPEFLLGVGLVLLFSALAFSGLIPFKAPAFLENIFNKADSSEAALEKSHGGLKLLTKSFVMGAGLGIVASPCVGPMLIAILTWLGTSLASGGPEAYFKGFVYLAIFGMGMSFPFLLLGHFIIHLHKRPHLGRYTPLIKNIGSGLLILSSFFFIIPALKILRAQHFPSSSAVVTLPHTLLRDWRKDQWTVVDFRADWCGACLELEEKTFSDESIRRHFDNKEWVYVQVDLTASTTANEELAQSFGVKGLPTVQIFAPGGKHCADLNLFGFEDAPAFAARLLRARTECKP